MTDTSLRYDLGNVRWAKLSAVLYLGTKEHSKLVFRFSLVVYTNIRLINFDCYILEVERATNVSVDYAFTHIYHANIGVGLYVGV